MHSIIIYYDLILRVLCFFVEILIVLIGVAFLTLLERKVLGYIQIRKGPNKVGLIGILQPFSDAIKLFTKEQIIPIERNYYPFYLSPVFLFFLSLFAWNLMPFYWIINNFNYGFLFLMCVLRVGVYGIMIRGWSSIRLYSMIGGLRCVAQTISYEVSLSFVMIGVFIFLRRYNLFDLYRFQRKIYFIFIIFPLAIILIVSFLAERNRTPFDFSEAESELVSGFNIEYGRGGFALIFLAEYRIILFMRIIFVMFFLGGNFLRWMFFLKFICLRFFYIWVRGRLPRYRYDKLIGLCWKRFLGFILIILIYLRNFWSLFYLRIL